MPQTPQYLTLALVFVTIDFAVMLAYAGLGACAARLMAPAPEEALVVELADAATRANLARRA